MSNEMSDNSKDFSIHSRPETPTVSFLPPKPVVLVGLMGCGKTSIPNQLENKVIFH